MLNISFFATIIWLLVCLCGSGQSFAQNSVPEKIKSYCEYVKPKCETIPLEASIKNFLDVGAWITCEKYLTENHCEAIKAEASDEHKSNFLSCERSDICTGQEDLGLLKCLGDGFEIQLTPKNLVSMGLGFISTAVMESAILGGAVLSIPAVIFSGHNKAETCDQNIELKKTTIRLHNLMLLPNEKPLDVEVNGKDVNDLHMPCSELNKFLQTRLEVMLIRRNQAKLDHPSAPEQKSKFDLSISQSRCLKPNVRMKYVCDALSGAATGVAMNSALGWARATAVRALLPKPIITNYTAAPLTHIASAEEMGANPNFNPAQPGVRLSDFEKVNYESLDPSSIRPASGSGAGMREIQSAQLDGEKVFVKVSQTKPDRSSDGRPFSRFKNDVYWTKRLSDLGIGPKFKGVTVTPDGYNAIVTDFVEGVHVDGTPASISKFLTQTIVTQDLLTELKRIRFVLRNEKIVPDDLQLRADGHHAHVIDPEACLQKRAYDSPSRVDDFYKGLDRLIDAVDGKLKGQG